MSDQLPPNAPAQLRALAEYGRIVVFDDGDENDPIIVMHDLTLEEMQEMGEEERERIGVQDFYLYVLGDPEPPQHLGEEAQ